MTAAINAELIAWFAELPAWQNEAFRRLLAKSALDESDYDQILTSARIELRLETGVSAPIRLTEADLPTAPAVGTSSPQLTALHSLSGVNMLARDQRLNIGTGLTLIYGSNGAGKSGYARIFKLACLCHEKATERILPNVYEPLVTGGIPSASFDVSTDDVTQTITWQVGIAPIAALRRFVVFDTKAARGYLSERNVVSAIPPVLIKLERLGEAIKVVKDRLASEAAAIQPGATALQPYVDATIIGKLVGSLTVATLRESLVDALVWTEADQVNLSDCEQREARFKAEGPQALRRQLEQRRNRLATLTARLRDAEQLVADTQIEAISQQRHMCTQLQEQKESAAKLALSGAVIKGVGSTAWEDLMRAAAIFFLREVEPDIEFPGPLGQSHCVLCQQPIEAPAHVRLQRFWRFLQDDVAQRLISAREQLQLLVEPLKAWKVDMPAELAVIATNLAEDVPMIWPQVPPHLAMIAVRRDAVLLAVTSGDWALVPSAPVTLSSDCAAEQSALLANEQTLGDPAQAIAELTGLTVLIRELVARKHATAARETILGHHQRLVRANRLREASDSISTLATSTKNKALQKKHITKAFTATLQQHARELGLRNAVPGIVPSAEYAKVTHSMTIEGAKIGGASPDHVFSEGEQTALALAYFFAEHTDAETAPALIFDDPVTSLSHRIRAKVVEKIAGLAARGQVIVFTHDLTFYCGIKDAATHARIPLALRSIEAAGRHVGLVREGEPVDAMSVAEREKWLESLQKEAVQKDADGDVAGLSEVTARFYGLLRKSWERAVEELLFNKVVMRFDDAVKTQSLTGAVIDAAIITKVFAAMRKCSAQIDGHDHAIGANAPQLDPTDMKSDLAELSAFRVEQKRKSTAQAESLKHLKA